MTAAAPPLEGVDVARYSELGAASERGSTTRDPLYRWGRRVGDARAEVGRLTSRWRPLPHFLLIGGQRCGTTFLFHALAGHPDVVPPTTKEVHYLTHHWGRGEAWYRGHFPLQTRIGGGSVRSSDTAGSRRVAFDSTPYYLFHPQAAARAAAALPEAKVLVLLRDPVDRAYSHYWHSVQRGWEDLEFEAAIAAERHRLDGEAARLAAEPGYVSMAHRVYSYLDRGRYAEQLTAWLRHFPSERLLAIRSEDLFADPARHYPEIVSFLGLPEWTPDFAAARRTAAKRASRYAPMSPALRARLHDHFQADNAALAEMLGWTSTWPRDSDERETAAQSSGPY